MGTMLSSPEETLVKVGEKAEDFLVMIKGEGMVIMKDRYQREYSVDKLLIEGNHFGEIGLLYKCARTATVISRNYVTVARLSRLRFNELMVEYPDLKKSLTKNVYNYSYDRKTYIRSILKKVEYLNEFTKE